ncbi:MAG: hypothetical protein Q4F60_00505 [Candidatus Saccharibacteria bacterium]|nr:hypothetical protein [Candidatus Saccharibacteria bacterium]
MAEEPKVKVINRSGTLKMSDETAERKQSRDIAGRPMGRRGGRRNNRGRGADTAPKEFEEVTISIDRVSRTVKGGRRMRFKALVAVGNHKNKIGIGVAKGSDVTTAVQKASKKAHKNIVVFNMDKETICHEVETKSTGADVLMKPAAPGTGIIAGGVVRSIIGLTGIKNLISKSLGSTNKVNIAYAVIEGLRQQVPRSEWETTKLKGMAKGSFKADKKSDDVKKAAKAVKAKIEKKVEAVKADVEKKATVKKADVEKKAKTVKADVEEKVKAAKADIEKKATEKKAEIKKKVATAKKTVAAKKADAKKEEK